MMAAPDVNAASALRILIVDDDEGDRRLVERSLRRSGIAYSCTEAASVEEALQACEALAFDCVLLDYRIPGQDGLSGVSALKAREPFIAIIMLTSQGDESVAAEAMKRGAADYLPKSLITPESLLRAVKRANEKTALEKTIAEQREALKNFSRLLVHDLKSPIRTLQGFAKLMARNIKAGKLEDLPEYCDFVVNGAERLAALIDALHGYAMAETPPAFELVEMDRVARDSLTNLQQAIHDRGARVTCGALPRVLGHGPQLTQLLQNLVSNGIKYCQGTPSIHIAAAARDSDWLFTVTDNGIGIAGDQLRNIFEPFKRLHGVGEYEGSGLGLATCKKIVERHHGRIWCESQDGAGSTFFFTLEGAPTSSPAPHPPA